VAHGRQDEAAEACAERDEQHDGERAAADRDRQREPAARLGARMLAVDVGALAADEAIEAGAQGVDLPLAGGERRAQVGVVERRAAVADGACVAANVLLGPAEDRSGIAASLGVERAAPKGGFEHGQLADGLVERLQERTVVREQVAAQAGLDVDHAALDLVHGLQRLARPRRVGRLAVVGVGHRDHAAEDRGHDDEHRSDGGVRQVGEAAAARGRGHGDGFRHRPRQSAAVRQF
jgi:hypothetical protein